MNESESERIEQRDNPYAAPAEQADREMADGARCPKCNGTIGFWALVRSRLPLFTSCPHCGSLLVFDGMLAITIVLTIVALLVGLSAQRIATSLTGRDDLPTIFMSASHLCCSRSA